MPRTAFTLRIEGTERAALEHLSKIERRPINQLLNDAIKLYLTRKGQKERSLESTLEALRKYRKQNAGVQRAFNEFVEAEAALEDPVEGKVVEGQFIKGQFKPTRPARNKIRKLLSA